MNILDEVGIGKSTDASYFSEFKYVLSLCKIRSVSFVEVLNVKKRLGLWFSNIRKRRKLTSTLQNLQNALSKNTQKRIEIEQKLEIVRVKIATLKQYVHQQMRNHYMNKLYIAKSRGQTLIFSAQTAEKWLTHGEYMSVENAKYYMIVEDVLCKQLDATTKLSNNLHETLLSICNLISHTEFATHLFELAEITDTLENVEMNHLSSCISESIESLMQNLTVKHDSAKANVDDAENAIQHIDPISSSSNKFKERFFNDIFESATKVDSAVETDASQYAMPLQSTQYTS